MTISTIIPVYNSEKYLQRCIDSVLAAQIKEVENEIILVNDGSTDASLEICEKYATTYSNIKVFSQENKGPSAARNYGLDKAQGNWIAFVDSDDYVEKEYFQKILSFLNGDYDILIIGSARIDFSGKKTSLLQPLKTTSKEDIIDLVQDSWVNKEVFWFPGNKIFRSKILEDVRFNTSIRIGEDTIFNIRAFLNAKKVFFIDCCLYNYVYNENSLTNIKYREGLLENMENHYLERKKILQDFPVFDEKKYNKDVADYYIEHILFWLLGNLKNAPQEVNSMKEMKKIRKSIIYRECFKYYKINFGNIKKAMIIKLFQFKQFFLIQKFLLNA